MLDKVDLTKTIDKEEFKQIMSGLELKLGELQREAKDLKIPLIIVFEGWDAAGKGTLINELILPLDPRGYNVHSIKAPNEEESLRPFLWRFWTKTPAHGRIAIFDRSWYRRVFYDRIDKQIKDEDWKSAYDEIKAFERQLADDGTVIIKFFLHISEKEQKKRFEKLQANPATSWRVTDKDLRLHEKYYELQNAAEEMIEKTETEFAPWTIIEAHEKRFAIIKIYKSVIEALTERIEIKKTNQSTKGNLRKPIIELKSLDSSVLDVVDLSKQLTEEEYKEKLKKYQDRLREIEHEIYIRRMSLMIMYEGWDAAGKGGNIKRVVSNLDPRGYEVLPIAAPNDIEKAHHYMWRFWNAIPKAGHIAIFDRTWYGRVLVERVEGFCTETEWRRAYKEINETEAQLANAKTVLVKFWLHIDKDEQLRRFEERQQTPSKLWKITEEDWRNREKWDTYKDAVDEMIFRTSTTYAPWTIIESNNKYWARIKTLKTIIDSIEKYIK